MEQDNADTDKSIDEVSRPFKRRKFYRRRADLSNHDIGSSGSPSARECVLPNDAVADEPGAVLHPLGVEQARNEESHPTVAELLLRRKAAQRRKGGIEFTNNAPATDRSAEEARPGEEALENEDSFDKILTVVDRFAPQTGQVADVDKHMYEEPQPSSYEQRRRY